MTLDEAIEIVKRYVINVYPGKKYIPYDGIETDHYFIFYAFHSHYGKQLSIRAVFVINKITKKCGWLPTEVPLNKWEGFVDYGEDRTLETSDDMPELLLKFR